MRDEKRLNVRRYDEERRLRRSSRESRLNNGSDATGSVSCGAEKGSSVCSECSEIRIAEIKT